MLVAPGLRREAVRGGMKRVSVVHDSCLSPHHLVSLLLVTLLGLTRPDAAVAHLLRSLPGDLPDAGDVVRRTGHGIGHGSGRSLVRYGPIESKPQRHSITTDIESISSYTPNGYYYGKEGEGGFGD